MTDWLKHCKIGSLITILLICGFIILCGCTSSQKNFFSKSTPSPTPTTLYPTTIEKHWIQIDPIDDYKTDDAFRIIGSTKLVVNGTTDLPAGTRLDVTILKDEGNHDLKTTKITVLSNDTGPNSFTYIYDMKDNPPGQYQVLIADSHIITIGRSLFNITSSIHLNKKWIHMDPFGDVQKGQRILISGTTDLPPGNQIVVESAMEYHSCYTPTTPDPKGQRSLCGGGCIGTETIHQTARVVEGSGSVNTWNVTVEIGDWCTNEKYSMGAFAVGWANVTSGGQSIRFIK